MKNIIILLLIVGISYSQGLGWTNGVPTWLKFGVNPTGTIDMKSDTLIVTSYIKGVSQILSGYLDADSVDTNELVGTNATFTSLNTDSARADYFTTSAATSYQYYSSSAAADSLVWVQTQAAGDNDMVVKFVEDDGTVHSWWWDDQYSVWSFNSSISVTGGMSISQNFSIAGTVITSEIDANVSGAGTLKLGETGDNDLTNMNSQLYYTPKTIAANDATPSVAGGNIFTTSANTGATEITDLDDCTAGQTVTIIGGSDTNSSTIADGGNFNLSGAWTAAADDVLILYVQADNDYLEIGRVDN